MNWCSARISGHVKWTVIQIELLDLRLFLAWVKYMKRFLTLVSTLTLISSVSPALVQSAWASDAKDATASALKHNVYSQDPASVSTTSTSSYAAPSVSRRFWVDYAKLPRNSAGNVNTASVANWSVNLPNDDREYLYDPSTRQLTPLNDVADRGQMPSLLVEMTTNTSSDSVRVCRKGFSFLGFSALRCREADLADLPVREESTSGDVITSSSGANDVTTTEASNTSPRNTTTVDVALRGVDSAILAAGDRVGGLVVTRGWTANHIGTDLALPPQNGRWPDSTGIPIYAIGAPGSKVEVRCWYEPIGGQNASTYSEGMDFAFDFSHLDSCIAGERGTVVVNAGDQIGTIGNSGSASTGPHLHMQQRQGGDANPITGTQVEAWKGYIEIALTGIGTDNVASNR